MVAQERRTEGSASHRGLGAPAGREQRPQDNLRTGDLEAYRAACKDVRTDTQVDKLSSSLLVGGEVLRVQLPAERHSQRLVNPKSVRDKHVFVVDRPDSAPQPLIGRTPVPTIPKISPCDKVRA